jgi:hypothetical protein
MAKVKKVNVAVTYLEVSFTLINVVYSAGIAYDDCNMFIVQANDVKVIDFWRASLKFRFLPGPML